MTKVTLPLATPDKNIRGQAGGDGRANYFKEGKIRVNPCNLWQKKNSLSALRSPQGEAGWQNKKAPSWDRAFNNYPLHAVFQSSVFCLPGVAPWAKSGPPFLLCSASALGSAVFL